MRRKVMPPLEGDYAHTLASLMREGREVVVTNMGRVVYTYTADPHQWILVLLGMADEEID